MENGVQLIAKERQRQIDVEGYDSSHDDTHERDELSLAAACYAIPQDSRNIFAGQRGHSNVLSQLWPFERWSFKPSPEDRIKELTKAGALIAADIDRLLRLKNNENA